MGDDFSQIQYRLLDEMLSSRDRVGNLQAQHHKEMLDKAVASQRELAESAEKAASKASEIAATLAEHNSKMENEFRGQLKDQAETFIRKAEVLARFEGQERRMDQLREDIATLQAFRAAHGGEKVQAGADTIRNQWVTGLCIFAGIALAGLLISIAAWLRPVAAPERTTTSPSSITTKP